MEIPPPFPPEATLEMQADIVARWMRKLHAKNIRAVAPAVVTFFGEKFAAAEYIFILGYTTLNAERRVYCAGEVPFDWKMNPQQMLRRCVQGKPNLSAPEWIVRANMPVEGAPIDHRNRMFHPFGPNFILSEWDMSMTTEQVLNTVKRYTRTDFQIQYL